MRGYFDTIGSNWGVNHTLGQVTVFQNHTLIVLYGIMGLKTLTSIVRRDSTILSFSLVEDNTIHLIQSSRSHWRLKYLHSKKERPKLATTKRKSKKERPKGEFYICFLCLVFDIQY
jgi:hypothetical protein